MVPPFGHLQALSVLDVQFRFGVYSELYTWLVVAVAGMLGLVETVLGKEPLVPGPVVPITVPPPELVAVLFTMMTLEVMIHADPAG